MSTRFAITVRLREKQLLTVLKAMDDYWFMNNGHQTAKARMEHEAIIKRFRVALEEIRKLSKC